MQNYYPPEQAGYYYNGYSPQNYFQPQITIKKIGHGAFGAVWSVIDPRTQKKVALKRMQHIFQNLGSCKRVFREIMLLGSFNHDNVLGLLDILKPPPQSQFFQEM